MKKIISVLLLCFAITGLTPCLQAQDYNMTVRSTLSYPGQTLANICGYAQDGREYALVGASLGLSIVDITNPDSIYEIVQLPGPNNLWKEIKVYKNYAYVTSEGGEGVQVVDMTKLPSPDVDYINYMGDGTIQDQLNTIHALHIDTAAGFLYTTGGDFSGITVHDLNDDPFNPHYVGEYQQGGYVHDAYVNNDTLYACHIYSGQMTMVDMKDKSNPIVMGTVTTPTAFTHNAWPLPGATHILTTDETDDSWLTCYDVTDPTDIFEVDRLQTTPGSGSVVHNTHVTKHYAVTSWYTDGVNIVDGWRPQNLVQVGRYDTYPGTGGGFDGCWGTYPFFPSETIIASNIEPAELFVLTPTYVEACYVEGHVTDACTGTDLKDAVISINHTDPLFETTSNNNGIFRTGQPTPGDFTVTVSKAGYAAQTFDVTLAPHEVIELEVTLDKGASYDVGLTIQTSTAATPVANTSIFIIEDASGDISELRTDALGQIDLSCISPGTYTAGAWGFRSTTSFEVTEDQMVTIALEPGYYDDFALRYDWVSTGTASSGQWEWGVPDETSSNQNGIVNPGVDAANDNNEFCFVTGNGGGNVGNDDVDNGIVDLRTPKMDLTQMANPSLSFSYWFVNTGGNGTPNDQLDVYVDNGIEEQLIFTNNTSMSAWREASNIFLKDFVTLTDDMTILFRTADGANSGHLVEAAIDIFEISEGLVNAKSLLQGVTFNVLNNPSTTNFTVQYDVPMNGQLAVSDAYGKLVLANNINTQKGAIELGDAWNAGVYFLSFIAENGQRSETIRLVKQ